MNNKKTYHLEVTTIENGQRRKYGDTYRTFTIVNNGELSHESINDRMVESFCTAIVSAPVRFKDSPCHFDSKETVTKIDERTYKYEQVVPSTH